MAGVNPGSTGDYSVRFRAEATPSNESYQLYQRRFESSLESSLRPRYRHPCRLPASTVTAPGADRVVLRHLGRIESTHLRRQIGRNRIDDALRIPEAPRWPSCDQYQLSVRRGRANSDAGHSYDTALVGKVGERLDRSSHRSTQAATPVGSQD